MQVATPQLLPGQRLTLDEFLRRWEAMPELKRAELIDGIVYMPSPVGRSHSSHELKMAMWIGAYESATPGTEGASNPTVLLLGNAPQPDVFLRILAEYGGQSRTEGELAAGPPELAVEVCATSKAYDLGPKLKLYERAGVREHLTLILKPAQVIWRELVDGKYVLFEADPDGILRSRVFPGLWLDSAAAIAGDGARVLAVLQQGLASPEHAEFVRTLAWRRSS